MKAEIARRDDAGGPPEPRAPREGARAAGYAVVRLRGRALRWAACAVALAALALAAASSARRAAAETLLEVALRYPVPVSALETARSLDPENPEAHYRLGVYHLDGARAADPEAAGSDFERAVALAPNRSSYWVALGRQREAAGREDEAERAYRRAAETSPWNWRPEWMLGNLYVRQGRAAEAAEALGRAAERNTEMASLAAKTMWRASGGDAALAARAAGGTLRGQLDLAHLLVAEKQVDAAVAVWREAVARHPGNADVAALGASLAGALTSAGRGEDALAVWREVAPAEAPEPGAVRNGGFEEPVAERPATPFAWAVAQSPGARVSVAPGRAGGKALRVDYRAGAESFTHAMQSVAVRPGAPYTLVFWAAAERLESGGLPEVLVTDPAGKAAAATVALRGGTAEWAEYRVRFTGPAGGVAVVSVGRRPCGDVCPIVGTLLVDDFVLEP